MRTILFATTALVASASIAAAEVSLSGSAEMGVAGGGADDDATDGRFHTDIDVTFTLTGETDTGLTFGADIDLDEEIGDSRSDVGGFHSDATRNDEEDGGATIFISGAFGTLTMGDTDGAFDWALQDTTLGTALRLETWHAGINGAPGVGGRNAGLDGVHDGQIARYDYAFENFSIAASAEVPDEKDSGDPALGLGAKHTTEFQAMDLTLGAGVQTVSGLDEISTRTFNEDDDVVIWGLNADMSFDNGFRLIASYSDLDSLGGWDRNWSLATAYSVDAFTVTAGYGEFDAEDTSYEDQKGWSLVGNYDLGGGATLSAAYANNEMWNGEEFDEYSFGVAMAF